MKYFLVLYFVDQMNGSLPRIYVLQWLVICITKDNIENVKKGRCRDKKVLGLFVYTMINGKQYKLMPI